MSLSEKPSVSGRSKIGCFVLAFIVIGVNAWLIVGAAMGNCAPDPDGTGCENDALIRWWMSPGFLYVSMAIMAFAGWRALKRRD
jgi:hypothetical protein